MGQSLTIDQSEEVVDESRPLPASTQVPAGVVDEDVHPDDQLPDRAVLNADRSVTLTLLYPQTLQVKQGGAVETRSFGELVFYRLTGADQRAIAATSEEMQGIVAFSRSARLSQVVMTALFDKMDLADITAAGQVINSFFATGRKTGRS